MKYGQGTRGSRVGEWRGNKRLRRERKEIQTE